MQILRIKQDFYHQRQIKFEKVDLMNDQK